MTHSPLNLSVADIHDIYAVKALPPGERSKKTPAVPVRAAAKTKAPKAAGARRIKAAPADG